MDTTSQDIYDLADEICEFTMHSYFSNSVIIADVLLLLQRQKPEYSGFQFKGIGGQALVLKVISANCTKPVALKIRQFNENDKKGIQHLQREQNLLKMFTFCKYIIQVNNSFYLTKKKRAKDLICYFVQEMELCDEDLAEYFLEFKKEAKPIDNDTKILLTIQMLDAINTLHQRNVMHRDIKPHNFLVSDKDQPLPTLKLSDLSFSSPLSSFNTNSFLSGKGSSGYLSPEAADNQSRLESDLFSLGIIIIELDNTSSFDFSNVKQSELAQLHQGKIFENQNINRNSILYQIASTFLQPLYKNRSTASQALFILLNHTKNLKKLQLFSIVTLDQLSYDSKFLPTQSEYQASIQALESQKSSYESIQEEINILITKFNTSFNCSYRIQEEQIQYILKVLLSSGEFENCEYLGVGATGLIFGIFNIKHQRQSVLKLCLCKNEKERVEKLAEAALMRQCQMPYIVKFYGHQFLKDNKGTTFVIEEYERCFCTLSKFLEELKEEGRVLSDKQKMIIAIQMMDSVNYLHDHSFLHCDIKLDNYLVSSISEEEITVKLSDFDQSAQLDEDWFDYEEKEELTEFEILPPYNCLINSAKAGSCPYNAPERFLNSSQTTKKTDCFSVGLCVAILDNYMTFTEEYLCISYFQYFMDKFDNPFEDCSKEINKDSPLFPIIVSLLDYSPQKRSSLGSAISKVSEEFPKYSIPSIFPFSNKGSNHLNYLKIDQEQYLPFLEQIPILTNLLKLDLNLQDNNQSDAGVEYLSNALKTLTNLQNLTLNLRNNKINAAGAEYLSNTLKTLTNLSNLNLNLCNNSLSSGGAKNLSNALKELTNLSSLNLNLCNNNINVDGAKNLSNALKTLTNLSNLNLNLCNNSMSIGGAEYLSNALKTLSNLLSLNLNLKINNLGASDAEYLSNALKTQNNLINLNLNLWDNNLSCDGAEYLSNALKTLTNLSNLNLILEKNNLSASGTEYLSNALKTLINLSNISLNLCNNSLSDPGAEYLSNALKSLTNLSNLNLNIENNNLSCDGAEYLSNALKTLTNLLNLNLNLRYNNINSAGAKYLSNALKSLINLSNLNLILEKNNLSASGTEYLSNALKTLINLSNLNLNLCNNSLSDPGAEYLSNDLKSLTNLSNLNLNIENNNISPAGAKYLSNALKTLTNLQKISFHV